MGGGLGGHDEHFAAAAADGGEQGLEGFEVGHAEGAPVAAEVWVGGLGGWVVGGEGEGLGWVQRRTNDPEEGVVGEGDVELLDGV